MVGSMKTDRCGISDKIIIYFNSIYDNFVLSSLKNGVYHSCLIIFEIGTTLFNKMKHLRCIVFFLFLFKQGLNGLFHCIKRLAKAFDSRKVHKQWKFRKRDIVFFGH